MAWNKVIDDAMDEWHERLWACINDKGGHFEYIIQFQSTPNATV